MTATIKTLDALKAATLRLDKVERYVRMVGEHRLFTPTVHWKPCEGWDGYDEVVADIAALIAPNLHGLMTQALQDARDLVADVSCRLRVELNEPAPHPGPMAPPGPPPFKSL